MRVSTIATNKEIQDALHQLYNSSPQGSILSTNEDSGPQDTETRPTAIAATAISKIQLDKQLKNSLHSSLQHEIPYVEILEELPGGTRQIKKNH